MGIVLGRSTIYLPVVIVALFVTLQAPSGKAQQTHLLVGDAGKDGILVYDGDTRTFRDGWGLSPTGGPHFPQGLIFGPDGHLYVSSLSTHSILRYDGQTGAFLDAFVSFDQGGLTFPT
jgi:outer membrane protein assembly factor BamB